MNLMKGVVINDFVRSWIVAYSTEVEPRYVGVSKGGGGVGAGLCGGVYGHI